ncbi:MAG: choice-of-anchor Q domain-containing protein [Bacteroidota bacterium]
MTNSTITGSTPEAIFNNGNGSSIIRNSILWNNGSTGSSWSNNNSTVDVAHSLVQEADEAAITTGITYTGTTVGAGMIYAQDPLFTDAANGDLTLQPCSPAINAGSSTTVTIMTDAAGNPRVQLGEVDMGAFESATQIIPVTPEMSLTVSPAQVQEDANQITFVFTFTASLAPNCTDLSVNFSVLGTATFNDDYYLVRGSDDFDGSTGTVTIPQGQTSVDLVFQAQQDAIQEGNETIIITIENP